MIPGPLLFCFLYTKKNLCLGSPLLLMFSSHASAIFLATFQFLLSLWILPTQANLPFLQELLISLCLFLIDFIPHYYLLQVSQPSPVTTFLGASPRHHATKKHSPQPSLSLAGPSSKLPVTPVNLFVGFIATGSNPCWLLIGDWNLVCSGTEPQNIGLLCIYFKFLKALESLLKLLMWKRWLKRKKAGSPKTYRQSDFWVDRSY